jgi:hypothetical protein
MKGKIILFDIDDTIFNPDSFLGDFYSKISTELNLKQNDIEKIKEYYVETKKELNYFSPTLFLEKISANFPKIDADYLLKIFWNIDLFEKNVYKDASVIKDLSRIADIGIFSKGDENFQKQKIQSIINFIEPEDIHIYKNKLEKINDIFSSYRDFEVYLIDNERDVLEEVRKINSNIYTILIDRKNRFKNLDIIKIKNLAELKSLIYD